LQALLAIAFNAGVDWWSPLQFLLLAVACLEVLLFQIHFVPCLEAQHKLRALFFGLPWLFPLSLIQFLK